MTGGVVSIGPIGVTVTVNVDDAVKPSTFRALQVTVVVPMTNVEPDAGVQPVAPGGMFVKKPSGSLKVAVYVTTAPAALVAAVVMLAGTETSGFVRSRSYEPTSQGPAARGAKR